MMRTSTSQFEVMVDFMERNGDLNRPADGPNGRLTAINLWRELCNTLNLDATGTAKPVDKWKKVWSDLKNNTKRKAAKVNRAANGTGGGPACKLTLTDLEQRVLSIIGPQAATGLITIEEVGLELVDPFQSSAASTGGLLPEAARSPTPIQQDVQVESIVEDWTAEGVQTPANLPTQHHAQSPPRNTRTPRRHTRTPRRMLRGRRRSRSTSAPAPPLRTRRASQRQHVDVASQFLRSDEHWRSLAREFVTEQMRLREVELQQQNQWQTLFAKLIGVFEIFINKSVYLKFLIQ